MGIQGLLPLLKSISDPVHVSAYAGHRVGIDAYAWLHRGGHQCATELALHLPTDRHLQFCLARIRLLLAHRVRPVLVFDGGRLPEKRKTEEARAARRRKERELGKGLHDAGQSGAAFKAFQRCVSIHPGMAYQLIRLCRGMEGVEWVVAPYEADAQLAFLSMRNYVTAVISEDSDLLVFGCRRVLYKMDAAGSGLEILLANLGACTELPLQQWSHAQFQQMCVLSGCDYLPSLPSLGLKKAHALMRSARSWERAIKKLRIDGRVPVYAGYELDFHCALLCFMHQRVWDPVTRRLVHLTEPSDEVKAAFADLGFLGPDMSDDLAGRIADGLVHPETLREFGDKDMEGLQPPQHGTLRRALSDGELITADADVERVDGPAQSVTPLRANRKVEAISVLLVKNKIDGYFVSASEASRSGFVRPRPSKDAEKQVMDDAGAALVRAASLSVTSERRAQLRRADTAGNPFAAFAMAKTVLATATKAEAPGGPPLPAEPETALDDPQVVREEQKAEAEHPDADAEDDWEDRYEEDDDSDHAQLLTHAYSLFLQRRSSRSRSPALLPPDSGLSQRTPPRSGLVATFADSPSLERFSTPARSALPAVRAASPNPQEPASPLLSPSPSPPPPATGPVYSKYFSAIPPCAALQPSSSSPDPSPCPVSPAPSPPVAAAAAAERASPSRDVLLISSDDSDDALIDGGSDKENVDGNVFPLPRTSSQGALPVDLDDIEDVPSPALRPTPSPPPAPLFSAVKRSSLSLSPLESTHRSLTARTSRSPFPLSAPDASTVGKRRRAGGDDDALVTGGLGSGLDSDAGAASFFSRFRYEGSMRPSSYAHALPSPPLHSYASAGLYARR